jgi:integrase
MRGDGSVKQFGTGWAVFLAFGGREFRRRGFKTEATARTWLRQKRAEAQLGVVASQTETKLTVNALLDSYQLHLETRGKPTASFRAATARLRGIIGAELAAKVNASALDLLIRKLQAAKFAPATINKSLAFLRAAYRLAVRQDRLRRSPHFSMLAISNVRQGFLDTEAFEAIAAHLPSTIGDAARFAYVTAWRKGEVLGLTWQNIDREAGEIRIPTSKNGEPRSIPLAPLAAIIDRQLKVRRLDCRFVFHHDGKRFWDISPEWQAAAVASGLGRRDDSGKYFGPIFHDLRRSGVRNMIRAGVSQTVAMSISGHKTISMFQRYNVSSSDDRLDAFEKVLAFQKITQR